MKEDYRKVSAWKGGEEGREEGMQESESPSIFLKTSQSHPTKHDKQIMNNAIAQIVLQIVLTSYQICSELPVCLSVCICLHVCVSVCAVERWFASLPQKCQCHNRLL